jgi:hypothetical protein
MNAREQQTTFAPALSFRSVQDGLLQRKCACGNQTIAAGECVECANKKTGLQRKLAIGASNDPLEREADRVAEQILAAPAHTPVHVSPPRIQRYARQAIGEVNSAPASVEHVLASSGRPLEPSLRQDMEQRFVHDFSQVRVHTGAAAEQSTREVSAHAYTAGHNIVFDKGEFSPETQGGRRLLAHELTHVIQQSSVSAKSSIHRQERSRPSPAAVDTEAQVIIDFAQDTSRSVSVRAEGVVRRIIDQYFSNFTSMIDGIDYDGALGSGLDVTSVGRGSSAKGRIRVSLQFLTGTTQRHFSRRVLQVRHELRHIEQYRAGITGRGRQNEREFIAFYYEATSPDLPGTGRMQHSTRVSLIDAALGHYFCLSASIQSTNSNKRDELLARRTEEVRASHRTDLGAAPTSCLH